ncbi:MAG: lipopolysaccharide transport periplasmic protein LptA [Epsilonproteobacteria bacterium]|nr:MAG: lipopolysaccharide transport periplasmic protein LptA [Campylobacterota bacterium]
MKYILILSVFLTSILISEELTIQALEFKTDEKKGITIFSGDVSILKSSDEINASKIVIFTNKKREPIKFVANGDVSFFIKTKDDASYRGTAQKVIYLPEKKEYHFFEKVYLEQLGSKKLIIGEEVVLKTVEGKAYAKGAKKEPVIMIFNIPDEDKK